MVVKRKKPIEQVGGGPVVGILAQGKALERWRGVLSRLAPGKGGDIADDPAEGIVAEVPDEGPATVHLFERPEEAVEVMKTRAMGAFLIDCRSDEAGDDFGSTLAGQVLPQLLAGTALGRVSARRSILVILPEEDSTAHHAYAVGTLQLGGVFVNPSSELDVLGAARRIARPIEPGKIALCLAGGGIEGMFYELGILRALDEHLDGRSVTEFDIFSGISAGAVLGAFLANGVTPAEIAHALHGRESRVDPVTRGVLFDPNKNEVAKRVLGALTDFARGKWLTNPVDTAMKVTPTALFSGEKLRRYLEKQLTRPGLSNDFRNLDKELFVGVTDQDTGTHVTFGTEGLDDMPISTAVRASAAMTPYYNPEKIGDRYFVDGIFTRTIDIDVAVAAGARLVICVDPMTPVQVDEPGYVSGRGGFFNTVQSVKSMIRTRLSEAIERVEESYPEVTVFVFSPTPTDLEKMSGTLMRFFNRTETEEMAFGSARTRIIRDFEWLSSDLSRYGFNLRRC